MINWTRVTELCDEVGAEDFDEVVDLFLDEVEEVIERLRTKVDYSRLEQDLHFLKGSALSLGFTDFSDLCQDGESKSAGGQAESVDVQAIVDSFAHSRSQFLARLPDMVRM